MHIRLAILSVLVSVLYSAATAQSERPLEVGAQVTVLSVDPLGEGAGGVGARASYDLPFTKLTIAPELEFNYFPQDPDGNFGETQLLAGARAGIKIDRFGFFLKARPGLVHFGGGDFAERNGGSSNNLAVDLGGVFEWYASPRVALRWDLSDTVIRFPKPVFSGFINPKPAGWYHNKQGGFGVNFRF